MFHYVSMNDVLSINDQNSRDFFTSHDFDLGFGVNNS